MWTYEQRREIIDRKHVIAYLGCLFDDVPDEELMCLCVCVCVCVCV